MDQSATCGLPLGPLTKRHGVGIWRHLWPGASLAEYAASSLRVATILTLLLMPCCHVLLATCRRGPPLAGAVCRGHTDVIRVVVCDAASGCLFTGSDDCTLRRWALVTGEALTVYKGHSAPVTTACLMNGMLFSGRYARVG